MKKHLKPVQQCVTRQTSCKTLTSAVLTDVKGGVVYDMVTSPGSPRRPGDTTWG